MTLSSNPAGFNCRSNATLIQAILERREAIRYSRDQLGDNRCYLNYYRIWKFLKDSPPMPHFTAEDGMPYCILFYNNCRAEEIDEIPPGEHNDERRMDRALPLLTHTELVAELSMLQQAIVRHRDIEKIEGRPRTIDDDRALYRVLPERVRMDLRLPPREEFLVSTNEESGCPAFWQSHTICDPKQCDLQKWGPCANKK